MGAMLSVPVVNMQGESLGQMEIDPALLGGEVRPKLLKQAVVSYLDHQRQDSARTKGRSEKAGSTRKLYRQKGTGRARMGTVRTVIRRGGGVAFAKRGPRARRLLPKKMRRLARDSALLAKIQSNALVVVEELACSQPKTKVVASMLQAIGANDGCVLALYEPDRNVYLSGRNLPKTDVRLFHELSAYELLRRKKVVVAKRAMEGLIAGN
jgi:large subunit ribosomal protein L4